MRIIIGCLGFAPLFLFPPIVGGQTGTLVNRKSFEVASVRPAPDRLILPGGNREDGEVFEHRRTSLAVLIQRAYGVRFSQLSGPGWLRENLYEVVAKLPQGATAADVPAMLQGLLEDRFHLAIRRELRPTPAYALEVAESGPKLEPCKMNEEQKPKTLADRIVERNAGPQGLKPGECPSFQLFVDRDASVLLEANSMEGLVRGLQRACDRPVLDHTGLKGNFAIRFQASPMTVNAGETSGYPTVATVLKRLGLRLAPYRQDLEYVVVVNCDKVPTAN